MSDGIILDMVVATERAPPRHIVCRREDNKGVVCKITDKAMGIEIASFRVSDDLVNHIPQLLSLYIR